MILKLKDGNVIIELFNDKAPNHVKRFKQLSKEKKYDGVVFHRVIDGFMAQTGDVEYGNSKLETYDMTLSGLYDAIDAVLSLQDQVQTKEFFNSVHELLKQFKQQTQNHDP